MQTLCKKLFGSAFLLLLLVLGQSACQSPGARGHQAEIAEVDSLLMVVDYLKEKMVAVEMQRIEQEYPQVDQDLTLIIDHLPPLDQNKQFWIGEINQINRVHSAYQKFMEEGPGLMEALLESEKQLRNLRKSLAANQLNDKEAATYLTQEGQQLAQLHLQIRKRQPEAEVAILIWEERRAHFDSLAQALQP